MLEILKYITSGFWIFVGVIIVIALVGQIVSDMIIILINRMFRHWNIRKHGYPPSHCDADGDLKQDSSIKWDE